MTLVLFDIDGTLLCSGGSGRAAMAQAAGELYGRFDMFDPVSFAGAVDSSVVPKALEMSGIPATPRRVGRLHHRYVRRLRRFMVEPAGALCPGVPGIIERVKSVAHVGLLTGNWVDGAEAKLKGFHIWHHFEGCVGAYGGDAMQRNKLVPIAHARARRRFGAVSRIVVIGDTPADVDCARAGHLALRTSGVNVLSVAVETGFASADALRAAQPDLQVEDLEQGEGALLALIRG